MPHLLKNQTSIVYLILENSNKMAGAPLEAAIKGCMGLSRVLIDRGFRVGLISYNSFSVIRTHPISDYHLLNSYFRDMPSEGDVQVANALFDAYSSVMSYRNIPAFLLVISGSCSRQTKEALDVARAIKMHSVNIFTVGTPQADMVFLNALASSNDRTTCLEVQDLKTKLAQLSDWFCPRQSGFREKQEVIASSSEAEH